MSLTIEQMKFLEAKGLSLSEVIQLAEMGANQPRSANAERQARYRQRVKESKAQDAGDVTDNVTRYGNEGNAEPSLSPAPFLSPQTPQTNPHPHTHPDITTRARKGADFPMVDCTDPDTWADFLRNRKAKKLPNTASAHRKLIADLADISARTGWPPGQVFAACVAKGWGAIYDPRDKTDGKQHSQSTRPAIMDIGRSVAADLEREAAARAGY